jgi:hypothetical protein
MSRSARDGDPEKAFRKARANQMEADETLKEAKAYSSKIGIGRLEKNKQVADSVAFERGQEYRKSRKK